MVPMSRNLESRLTAAVAAGTATVCLVPMCLVPSSAAAVLATGVPSAAPAASVVATAAHRAATDRANAEPARTEPAKTEPAKTVGPFERTVRVCGPFGAPGEAPWPEFDGGAAHSGDGVGVTSRANALRVSWRTHQLDGALYAQPLVAGGCLFAATEDDSVYAFDAATGALRWKAHLATPVTSGLPCGDIDPSGITGTPVLDPATGELWAVVLTEGASGPEHEVVAIDAANGKVLRRQEIAVPGRAPAAEQQRSALVLANGNVYVALGGLYGDCSNYAGAVASVPVEGGRPGYWAVPTARQAGIWEPGGPDVLANGALLLADGNGAASPGQAFDGSDAVIELSPALKMTSYFAPSDWADLNASDLDLGSTGPALLPGGLAAQVGKSGTGYLVSTSRLGGVGGQLASVQVCTSGGAFGADAVSASTVYFPCQGGLVAVQAEPTSLKVRWRSSAGGEGSPVIAGGRLFEETSGGALEALNPATGGLLETVDLSSPTTHFPWLVAVGHVLYAADGASVVALRGL
jgi:outer membrane protein assembly factor BamB